jgi:hypothetical protein
MRQMRAGDGHAHQRDRHGWDYAQDSEKFSGFAAVPAAEMLGAYAQSVPAVLQQGGGRAGTEVGAAAAVAEVGVQPDWSCPPDREAQFSHGLDCRVMAGTPVGLSPPSSQSAAVGAMGGGGGSRGGVIVGGSSWRSNRDAGSRSIGGGMEDVGGEADRSRRRLSTPSTSSSWGVRLR